MDDNSNNPVVPTSPTPPDPASSESTPKKSRGKLVVLLITATLLFAGTAAATVLLLSKPGPAPEAPTTPVATKDTGSRLDNLKETVGVDVVPTLLDEIKTQDAAWCGTFQLVWNDMKNKVVHQDIVFKSGQIAMVDNLNQESFNESMLSPDYYYKTHDLKSMALKKEIEQNIKAKFNETSDILDDLDWSEEALAANPPPYIFYAMLRRSFDYERPFIRLDDGKFNDNADNVKYYGFTDADPNLQRQVTVLYYDSYDDFAILINTKQGDQVIYVKNPKGQTFSDIYNDAIDRSEKFKGEKAVQDEDSFAAPDLALNVKRNYDELVGHTFPFKDGRDGEISAAIQTIKLAMDEQGGEVKSEAVMEMKANGMIPDNDPRRFHLDSTFAMFLRESGRSAPYLALLVNDIKKYQP
jgi:hypothetical protein